MKLSHIVLAGIRILFAGCSNDNDNGINPNSGTHGLILEFQSREPLQGGFHYTAWAIIGGPPISTGNFIVDAMGNLVDLDGDPITIGRADSRGERSSIWPPSTMRRPTAVATPDRRSPARISRRTPRPA